MTIQNIYQHILLSLGPCLIGAALGGLIGYMLASWIKGWGGLENKKASRLILFPWRTLILVLVVIVFSPMLVVRVGLGNSASFLMTTSFIFLLSLPMAASIFLNNKSFRSTTTHMISSIRTLATSSIIITIWVSVYSGGGGLGFLMHQYMQLLEFNLWLSNWLVIAAITLVVDMLLGILQLSSFESSKD